MTWYEQTPPPIRRGLILLDVRDRLRTAGNTAPFPFDVYREQELPDGAFPVGTMRGRAVLLIPATVGPEPGAGALVGGMGTGPMAGREELFRVQVRAEVEATRPTDAQRDDGGVDYAMALDSIHQAVFRSLQGYTPDTGEVLGWTPKWHSPLHWWAFLASGRIFHDEDRGCRIQSAAYQAVVGMEAAA